jgi:peptide/nickel transport system substrate-binding protein
MRSASKRLTGLVAIAAATLMIAGACTSSKGSGGTSGSQGGTVAWAACATQPNTCNSGPTKKGGTLVVTDEKAITSFFVADGASNTYDQAQIMNALLPGAYILNPDGSVSLNTDLLVSASITATSPSQVVTYVIQPNAVWNDGTPITAADFIYSWQFENGVNCTGADCPVASTTGYDQITSVVGSGTGDKTVTVTFDPKKPYPDWKALFTLYPQHIAAKYAAAAPGAPTLDTEAGQKAAYAGFLSEGSTKNPMPAWSGGPYVITGYTPNVSVTLTPNPKWYGKTKPSLDKIVYRLILDATQEITALKNNEVNISTEQPDQNVIAQVKTIPNVNWNLESGNVWEHIDLNLKNKFLADTTLRQAIFIAINRQTIIDRTVKPFDPTVQPLNSHNFVNGQTGYQDVVTGTNQGTGNTAMATQMLTAAHYTLTNGVLKTPAGVPVTLGFTYTSSNPLRETTGELVQSDLSKIGIKVKLIPAPDLSALGTGDYDMIVFAWEGSSFLSGNVALWSTTGGSNFGHYSNPQVDALMAKSATDLDPTQEYADLNAADVIMTKDAYVLPLYQKPNFIAVSNTYVNVRNNPGLAGPSYNIQEWGLRTSAQ